MNGTMQRANLAKRPRFVRSLARMAKLADAADLKSAGSNPMGVQVPLRAPTKQKTYKKNAAREREAFFVWWLF